MCNTPFFLRTSQDKLGSSRAPWSSLSSWCEKQNTPCTCQFRSDHQTVTPVCRAAFTLTQRIIVFLPPTTHRSLVSIGLNTSASLCPRRHEVKCICPSVTESKMKPVCYVLRVWPLDLCQCHVNLRVCVKNWLTHKTLNRLAQTLKHCVENLFLYTCSIFYAVLVFVSKRKPVTTVNFCSRPQ